MNCTCGVCNLRKAGFALVNRTRFFVSCWQDGEQIFWQVQTLYTNNLFCLQNNVIATSRKRDSLHATQNSRAILKQEFSPYPRWYFIVQWTKFIWGPTITVQFIDTYFHVTSHNQGSFSKQDRDPWERSCNKCLRNRWTHSRMKVTCVLARDSPVSVFNSNSIVDIRSLSIQGKWFVNKYFKGGEAHSAIFLN